MPRQHGSIPLPWVIPAAWKCYLYRFPFGQEEEYGDCSSSAVKISPQFVDKRALSETFLNKIPNSAAHGTNTLQFPRPVDKRHICCHRLDMKRAYVSALNQLQNQVCWYIWSQDGSLAYVQGEECVGTQSQRFTLLWSTESQMGWNDSN